MWIQWCECVKFIVISHCMSGCLWLARQPVSLVRKLQTLTAHCKTTHKVIINNPNNSTAAALTGKTDLSFSLHPIYITLLFWTWICKFNVSGSKQEPIWIPIKTKLVHLFIVLMSVIIIVNFDHFISNSFLNIQFVMISSLSLLLLSSMSMSCSRVSIF